MSTATTPLPITETLSPDEQPQLAEIVRGCYQSATPVYPWGGATSLDYGFPAKRPGIGLALTQLDKIIDYPARDMTITVEAGLTMQRLAETLAAERQRLPVDVPLAAQATLGGVIATNFNGPRRYGQGSIRDHVIGITAVDGRGAMFKGGGRVVKNVAGYDFCKLLTGSLGTLGVITQVTLKLKPQPERLAVVLAGLSDLQQAEQLLAGLSQSRTTPAAVELLWGDAWDDLSPVSGAIGPLLAVALEGTAAEVQWMKQQLAAEWQALGCEAHRVVDDQEAADVMRRLAEFPAEGESPLVLKACVVPSATTRFVAAVRELDSQAGLQAHAGNGIIIARLSEFPREGLARTVIARLHPIAAAAHGHVEVLSSPSGGDLTHHSVWGAIDAPLGLMAAIKRQFDPNNILNPDRFVYP